MNEIDIPLVIRTVTVYAIPVLFAIALHEVAHGFTAKYFGDPTAAKAGRLSLNPANHIDLFGTILLPLLLYLAVQIPFGYAKPVPVDFSRLRNPKKQMVWVAFAGPAANFAMGLGWTLVLIGLGASGTSESFFWEMAQAGVAINAAMFVFNLIPIPPLDGGRIVTGLLPDKLSRLYGQLDRYSMLVFAGLVLLIHFQLLDGVLKVAMRAVIALYGVLLMPLRLLVGS